ncbi:hypothetical protein [Vibrio algicola]|uniref:Uncharacterized protein n=1 Tax=Vibrio algicola TaxID=2662262 RepID=A0A5Q0TCC4_9VIBR|nr:hypothetical protein [Vibrio algicola]
MAKWKNTDIQWPATANTIQQQAEGVLANVASDMQTNLGGLQSAAGSVTFAKGALSGDANALLNLRAQLNGLLVRGQVLTVHPYQYGIGQQQESGVFLSAQNAVNGLITKLNDQADDNRPAGTVNALAVLLTADNHQQFNQVLADFVQVLPVSELAALSRRVKAELSVGDKMNTPAVDLVPRYKPNGYINQNPLRDALKYQGAQVAQLESLASDQNDVVAKLQALETKRNAALSEWKAAIDSLKNISGSVQTFKTSGSASSIASDLKDSSVPNAQAALSAVVMFTSAEPLTFLEELLNV